MKNWWKAHQFLLDASLATVLFVLATADVIGWTQGGSTENTPNLYTYILLAGQTLPLAFRRRYPIVTMYVVCGSIGLYWIADFPLGVDGAAIFAIYSVAANGTNRRLTWINLSIAITSITVVAVIPWSKGQEDNSAHVALAFAALHIAGAFLGEIVYQRRQRLAALVDRAERAEEQVETQTRLAVANERTRIAREMHDVVAHGMSVITVQASAAQEIALTDPERTREMLSNIESVGRDSLTEMRRMLGVLRGAHQATSTFLPQPALVDLPLLTAQSIEAGLPVELVIQGTRRELSAGVELACFRLVQEALTNVRKHAGPSASATVTVTYASDEVIVRVQDDGTGAGSSLSDSGDGNGLIGMSERVAIYGGDFSAGPRAGGGYFVEAAIPRSDAADRPSVISADGESKAAVWVSE